MTQNARSDTIANICSDHDHRPDRLIEILHDVQHRFGCITPEVQAEVASHLNIARAEVFGVVSFYDDFTEYRRGETQLRICRGEACQAQGANAIWQRARQFHGLVEHEPNANGVELSAVYCLGNCVAGPAAQVNNRLVARLDEVQLDRFIEGDAR